jgi:hypothetical protein
MNVNQILSDDMTLEAKLEAIDKAMQLAQADFHKENGRDVEAPVDPSELTMCLSCQ